MIDVQPSHAFTASLSNAPTGQAGAVGVTIYDKTTRTVAVARNSNAVEAPLGSGIYYCDLVAPAIAGQYQLVWDLGTIDPDSTSVDDLDVGVPRGDPRLANLDVAVSSRTGMGPGGTLKTFTVRNFVTGDPVDGASAWVTLSATDPTRPIASDTSGSSGLGPGVVAFMLDPGTYYLWVQIDGFNSTTPFVLTVP